MAAAVLNESNREFFANKLVKDAKRLIDNESMIPSKPIKAEFARFCYDLCEYFEHYG